MTALAILKKNEIVQRVSKGHRLSTIAKDLGVTPSAISQQLSNDPEYQAAQISFHSTRLDSAEGMLESAEDSLNLARAREIWKAYSWRASVEQSRIWGQQQQALAASITVVINPTDSQGVVIDME